MKKRPKWDNYFMEIAKLVKTRSTCLRRQVGAVIVKDNRILATGYNGPPQHTKHCSEVGCLREKYNIPSGERHELCRGLHGEQNAILQAARFGTSIEGSVLYCTHQPCILCAKMLVNSGIKQIFIDAGYPDELSLQMLEEAEIVIKTVK